MSDIIQQRLQQFEARLEDMTPDECHAELKAKYEEYGAREKAGNPITNNDELYLHGKMQDMLYMKSNAKSALMPLAQDVLAKLAKSRESA